MRRQRHDAQRPSGGANRNRRRAHGANAVERVREAGETCGELFDPPHRTHRAVARRARGVVRGGGGGDEEGARRAVRHRRARRAEGRRTVARIGQRCGLWRFNRFMRDMARV